MDVDPDDGGPTWAPSVGTPLVDGQLAWRPLATGDHCQTWLCWSLEFWTPTLVKVVRPGWSSPRWTRSLAREAAALRPLLHPAFPRLLIDGTLTSLPHLVLEYLDGPALDQDLDENGPLSGADAARLAVGLLAAARNLHATGSAHLDICPDNVLVVDRRVRLVDLGAARPIGQVLRRGERFGTDGFTAPEATEAPGGPVTASMDVYGIGATTLAVLDPDADGPLLEILRGMVDADPDSRPTVEEALAALVRSTGRGAERTWPSWADRTLPRRDRRPGPRTARHDVLTRDGGE
jgi:serine/threonine protein kinase